MAARFTALVALCAAALLAVAAAQNLARATQAVCVLRETVNNVHAPGSPPTPITRRSGARGGIILFTPVAGGLRVSYDVCGLAPGQRPFYVHEFGDVFDLTGAGTGNHYVGNCTSCRPGLPQEVGSFQDAANNGTYPLNMTVDSSTCTNATFVDPVMSLSGFSSILGRSIIVHGSASSAGARVAMCVIGIANETDTYTERDHERVNRASCVFEATSQSDDATLAGVMDFEATSSGVLVKYFVRGVLDVRDGMPVRVHRYGALTDPVSGTSLGLVFAGRCAQAPRCRNDSIPGVVPLAGFLGNGKNMTQRGGVASGFFVDTGIRLNGTDSIIGRSVAIYHPISGGIMAQCVIGVKQYGAPTAFVGDAAGTDRLVTRASALLQAVDFHPPVNVTGKLQGYVDLELVPGVDLDSSTVRVSYLITNIPLAPNATSQPRSWIITARGDLCRRDGADLGAIFSPPCASCRPDSAPVGSLGNGALLTVDATGTARGVFVDSAIRFYGARSILGRAIVLRGNGSVGNTDVVATGIVARVSEHATLRQQQAPEAFTATCRLQALRSGDLAPLVYEGPMGSDPDNPDNNPPMPPVLNDTRQRLDGYVSFYRDPLDNNDVYVKFDLRGLPPGPHTWHVHESGDLLSYDDGQSTRGHFIGSCNATGTPCRPIGQLQEIGLLDDGRVITADGNGRVFGIFRDRNLRLAGPDSIVGRSIIVHGDGSSPTSGVRIGVCTIGVVSEDAGAPAAECRGLLDEDNFVRRVSRAVCTLQPTQFNANQTRNMGRMEFTLVPGPPEAVQVAFNVCGLSPGNHTYHVHDFGNVLTLDGSGTGDHFIGDCVACRNPGALQEVGNINSGIPFTADASGCASVTLTDAVLRLNGRNSIVGRSIIIHGNATSSGARVSQCVIGLADSEAVEAAAPLRPRQPLVTRAGCILEPTGQFTAAEGAFSNPQGYVGFEVTNGSDALFSDVNVRFFVLGLADGEHEVHVHVTGDVGDTNAATFVLGHYNGTCENACRPAGLEQTVGYIGDGYLLLSRNRVAEGYFTERVARLNGKRSVVGRSIVVHAVSRTNGNSRVMQCVIGIEAENVNGTLPPMLINGTVPYVTRATAVMRRTNLTSLTSVDGFFDFALDRARNDTVVTYWLAGLQAGTPYEVYVNTGGNECDGESALQINSSGVFVGDCNACRASLGPSINRVGNIRDSIFIVPDADGRARGAFRDAVVKLNGTNSIVGRSVVLRRRPDAGTLVAWGLIGRAQEEYYPLAFAPPFVQHASCRLQPTLLGNANITGYFAFSYDLSLAAVRVKYFARGLAPGQHRYSVNQYGDMFGADRALGTRGVFMGAPVRPRPPQQPQAVGAIDDGVPLVAGTEGQSFGSFIDYNLQLNDFNSIVGRGLVIYGNETDADVAVAQCVIGIAGEVPRDPFPTCPDLPQDPPQAICALASTSTSSRPVTGTVEIVALSDTQHKVTVKACGLSEGTHRWFVAAGGDIWQRDGTSPGDAFAGVCSNCRPSLPGNLQQVGRLGDDRLLTVPANSTCVFDTFFDSVIRLSGLNSVVGRAVVIFEAQAVNPALRVAQCVLGRSDFFSVDAFHASRPNVTRATVKFTNTSLAPEAIGGYMVFEDLGESVGVEMRFFMWGISMGRPHEFHVHLKGDVTDPRGNAVEGHFIGACNNTCRPQGILQEVGKVGDDYEMRARDKVTRGRIIDRVIKLNGPDSIVGRSVIIHGDGPNSGTHIAQGVIGIAREGVTADPPAVIGGTDPLVTRAQVILDSTNVTGALPLVGWVEMELVPGTHTVELTYSISGLSPGNHSWAITQRGDLCLQNGSSPGVTFVGTCSNCRPGGPQQVGAIGGGAPILADAFGVAEGRLRDPVLRFNDTNSIIGRALVVRGSVLRADDVVAQGVVGRVIEHPTRRGLPAPPVAEASCRMIPTYVISPAEQPVDIEGYVHLRRDEAIGRTVFTFRMARLPPGPHRWAIHASGDIISEDTGKSTRDVFVGNSTRQVGLIGDGAPLVASSFGTAQGVVLDAHALLTGANSVIGRSIVVFGNGLPGGDNVRIAFCVIGINSENASAPQTCALQEARPDPEESSASEGLSDTNVAIIIGISAVAFGLLLALLYSWWHRRHGGDRAAKNTAKMTAVATTELSPAPAPQAQGGFRPAAVVAGTAAGGTAVSAPEAVYGEWEMHRDDEGNPYYYNPRTQESRWEVPH